MSLEHVYEEGTFYCDGECYIGQQIDLVNWEFEIDKAWDDHRDVPVPVYIRFTWKCSECGYELVKTVSLGYAA